MAFNIVPGGVVRYISYYTYPSQVATNKRDYQCTSIAGGSTVDSDQVLATLDAAWSLLVKDCMTADAKYYGAQLYYQTPVGPKPRPSFTVANQGPGSDAGEALPLQTAGLISLYSELLQFA